MVDATKELCDYEKRRLVNIKKNIYDDYQCYKLLN